MALLGQALLWQTGGVNPNLLSARAARADLMKKAYPLLTAAELVNPPPSRVRVRGMVRLGFLTQTLTLTLCPPSPLRGGLAGWRVWQHTQPGLPAGGGHQLSCETAPLTYQPADRSRRPDEEGVPAAHSRRVPALSRTQAVTLRAAW